MPLALTDVRIDTAAEENGAWVDRIPDMDDLQILVRGWHCPAAQALIHRLARKDMSAAEIESRVLTDVILLGWRGLTDGGEPVAFTPALAAEMVTEPEYRLFRAAVRWASEQVGKSARMRSVG